MGASPIQQSAINNYLNPYQNQVVNATMGQLENVQQANNAAMMGGTLGSGGLFNDRADLREPQLALVHSLPPRSYPSQGSQNSSSEFKSRPRQLGIYYFPINDLHLSTPQTLGHHWLLLLPYST